MRKTALAASICLYAGASWASTCGPVDPLSPYGPPVWVLGEVVSVETSDRKLGTYQGAASVFIGGGRNAGSNVAVIRVDRVLKGDVGPEIRVASDMQDGVNLGLTFRPGPILLGAGRAKDGTLVTSACNQARIHPDRLRAGELGGDHGRDSPYERLHAISDRIESLGGPASAPSGGFGTVDEMDALLKEAGDIERRVLLWEAAVEEALPRSETGLAEALLYARRFEEAKALAAGLAGRGDAAARRTLQTALAHLGEKSDLSSASLSGERFKALDMAAQRLDGMDLSDLSVNEAGADGAGFAGADLERAWLNGSFRQADFSAANLRESRIDGDLDGADFSRAILDGAWIQARSGSGVSLEGAAAMPATVPNPGINDSPRPSVLSGNFKEARLAGFRMEGGVVSNADFDGADMRGSTFRKTRFEKVSLEGADLTGATLEGNSWKDVTYGCDTAFPAGFDPEAAGMATWEDCDGAGAKADKAMISDCDDRCIDWLVEDPARHVSVQKPGSGDGVTFRLSASFPGKDECPEAALREWPGYSTRERMTKLVKEEGFCPVIVWASSNPAENLFSGMAPGLEAVKPWFPLTGYRVGTNEILFDIRQIGFLDYGTVRNVALPRFLSLMSNDFPEREKMLGQAIPAFGKQAGLIADMVLEAMSDEDEESRGLGGAAFDSPVIHPLALAAAEADPSLRARPAYEAFFGSYRDPHKIRSIPCDLMERAVVHIAPWGDDVGIDSMLLSKAPSCGDLALIGKGLADDRSDIAVAALYSWTNLMRQHQDEAAALAPMAMDALAEIGRSGKREREGVIASSIAGIIHLGLGDRFEAFFRDSGWREIYDGAKAQIEEMERRRKEATAAKPADAAR